jgi:GT2 family glycosyltransferase
MVSLSIRPEVGCVGAKLYYPNDTLQHGGVVLGIKGVANHSHRLFSRYDPGYFGRLMVTQAMSAVTAACLLLRKELYWQVGGLNEEDLKVAFNDVDLCLKVRQLGFRNVWTPHAELYHHESVSRGVEDTPEKKARFAKEVNYMLEHWGEALAEDPYYNPNLSLQDEDFSLGWPPREQKLF